MRVKLLVLFLAFVAFSLVGQASVPQLTNVSVVPQGSTTTVTLHTTGAFTHNEYRPADHLLLVDLVGVSAGNLADQNRALEVPGVKAYHVVGYTGAAGVQIARLELTLAPHADVRVNPNREGLAIQVVSSGESTTADLPGTTAPAIQPPPTPSVSASVAGNGVAGAGPSKRVEVRNVTVSPDGSDILVEVSASGPLSPRTLRLTRPDRIVVDLQNAIPVGVPRTVAVNASGVIAVRTGRFQPDPPVTRVVVDLSAARDFDLSEGGDKLTLRVRPVGAHVPAAAVSDVAAATKPTVDGATEEPKLDSARPAVKEVSGESAPAFADSHPPQPTPIAATMKAQAQSTPDAGAATNSTEGSTLTAAQGSATSMSAEAAKSESAANGNGAAEKPVNNTAQDFVVLEPKVQERVSDKNPNQEGPAAASSPAGSQKPVNFAADQRQQTPQPALGPRYTGEPISVNLKDVDLKDFFRLIHEISGLNIVLDPSVSGSLTLVLDDVPWDQALDIVLRNNGLDRQLDGNVLRIASVETLRREADARRRQVEAQALAVDKVTATRFLSYAHAKDVLPIAKRLLSARGDIIADERTNSLILADIPSVIPAIDTLIAQLDRKTQEVEIEARVVAATRTFVREIGTQLGFGYAHGANSIGGAPQVGDSPNLFGYIQPPGYVTNPGVSEQAPPQAGQVSKTTPASIPLFSNLPTLLPTSGLNFLRVIGNYRLDALLTLAEARGLVKILSRPRVITQNNIQASVKQGQRVPITTAAQLNGPPTVTYVEAVLRLQVTPQITVENTIFLNVDIENTTPDFSNKINGNPVFLTQQATTQVLVTNGGTVVVGGVLQAQNALNTQQVPLLGNIPVLGNLFKHRSVNTNTAELLFFITPKIVET